MIIFINADLLIITLLLNIDSILIGYINCLFIFIMCELLPQNHILPKLSKYPTSPSRCQILFFSFILLILLAYWLFKYFCVTWSPVTIISPIWFLGNIVSLEKLSIIAVVFLIILTFFLLVVFLYRFQIQSQFYLQLKIVSL